MLDCLDLLKFALAWLTVVLAQSKSPPMGANITPIAKKIGSTVFGVRIGLKEVSW